MELKLILFNSVNLAIGIRLGAAVFMINKYQLIRLDYNSIELSNDYRVNVGQDWYAFRLVKRCRIWLDTLYMYLLKFCFGQLIMCSQSSSVH